MKNYTFTIVALSFYFLNNATPSINIKQVIHDVQNNEYVKKYNVNVIENLLDNESLLKQFNQNNYKICTTEQGSFLVDIVQKDHIKNIVIAKGKIWEGLNHCLIKRCIKKGTIAIDIGAHVGTYTVA